MANPYEVLGVPKTATADEIRRAYRKLAKKFHPDVNPGKAAAEQRFKEISAAHALLSDADKRGRYDRGEIDDSGQERQQQRPFYRSYAEGPWGSRYRGEGPAQPEDMDDFFADLFRSGRSGGGAGNARGFRAGGADVTYTLTVDFLDAVRGAKKRITLADGRSLDVDLPPGLADGQTIRLRGRGQPGLGGGPAGDALIKVTVAPHPLFRREGPDIVVELPVGIGEAILGAKVRTPTIDGPVTLTIPKWSSSGRVLRLKGRGVPDAAGSRGDQRVVLKVVLPDSPDSDLEALIQEWAAKHPENPRREMEIPA